MAVTDHDEWEDGTRQHGRSSGNSQDIRIDTVLLDYSRYLKPTLRNSHSMCSNDDKSEVYIFGGRSKGGSNNHLLALHIERITEGWRFIETRGTAPKARKSSALAYLNGCIYVFGGQSRPGLTNDLFCFQTSTQEWSEVRGISGSPPSPRDRHTMCAIAGKLWIFGGHTEESEFMNDLFSYDPKRKRWTKHYTSTPPTPRYEHSACECDGKMIIAGGKCRKGGLTDIHSFDVDQNRWSRLNVTQTNSPQSRWGASMVSTNKHLIFFGGWNGRDCFNDIHVVDLSRAEYLNAQLIPRTKGKLPVPRTFHTAGILGKKMIITSGRNMVRRLNDSHAIDLSTLFDACESEKTSGGAPTGGAQNYTIPKKEEARQSEQTMAPDSVLAQDFRREQNIDKSNFEITTTLGTGSFGRVRLCKYNGTEEFFAMKILRKTRVIKMKQENHIKWEKKILCGIRHPFIVNLEAYFQDDKKLYLVLELVQGGEFFSLLRKTGVLQLPHAAFYASQIVLIFQFLHKNKIVYRDLKPENLLIGSDGYLKLTDFGFAKRLDKNPPRTWTLCGTPEYIAPEILLNKGHGFSVDWWALGILLFEMFTGNPPFVDDNPLKIYQKILDAQVVYPADLPRKAQLFIAKLLTPNLSRRLGNLKGGAMDVMMDPFFNGVSWRQVLEKRVRAPYVPDLDRADDTHYFDDYNEESDNEAEDIVMTNDPFMNDF